MWKGKEPRCFQRSSIFWSLHRCPRLTRRILLLSSPPLVPIALSPCTRKGHHAHLSSVTSRPHVSTVVVVVPHQEWGSSSTKKKEKQPHIGTEQDAVTKDCTDQTAWLTCFVRQKWGKCKKAQKSSLLFPGRRHLSVPGFCASSTVVANGEETKTHKPEHVQRESS